MASKRRDRGDRGNHSSDDDYDDCFPQRKKSRRDDGAKLGDSLESLIMRVGKKSKSTLETNLEGLASVLESDLPNHKRKIVSLLSQCVIKLPSDVTIYTTLVGLLNAVNGTFGGEFLESVVRLLKDCLKNEEYENANFCFRFISDLVNCHVVEVSSLLNLYEIFIDVTHEPNSPQVRSDWFIFAVLSSLPWSGRELNEKKPAELEQLIHSIDLYIKGRKMDYLPLLQVWSKPEPHIQEDYLDCLWSQIKKLHSDSWRENIIQRSYKGFDEVLSTALTHKLPTIHLPPHDEDNTYPLPSVVFRLFDYTDCDSSLQQLPGHHSVERALLEDQLKIIILDNCLERKVCANLLVNHPYQSKVPLNNMIIEVIFSMMLKLPCSPHPEVFYTSLLFELCREDPSTIPMILAFSVELIYSRIDSMHFSCIDRMAVVLSSRYLILCPRFANWFSHHLSNFQFKWTWKDWSDVVKTQNQDSPRLWFVRETIAKCVRISYLPMIKSSLPEEFYVLLPQDPEPHYNYGEDGNCTDELKVIAEELCAAVKGKKATAQDLVEILKKCPQDDLTIASNVTAIDLFTQSVFFLGSKTVSYSFNGLAKYANLLKVLADTEDGQIAVLNAIHSLWEAHPLMVILIVDKLIKSQVVTCRAVVNWLFSREMSPHLTKMYVWEVMHYTLRKMNQHVQRAQSELVEIEEKLVKHTAVDKDWGSANAIQGQAEDLQERLDSALAEQKSLFLIVLQRFIMTLGDQCSAMESNPDWSPARFTHLSQRLEELFLRYNGLIHRYIDTLESLLFTSDIDARIVERFQRYCLLKR